MWEGFNGVVELLGFFLGGMVFAAVLFYLKIWLDKLIDIPVIVYVTLLALAAIVCVFIVIGTGSII